jgi:hypothetical protein
VRQDVGLRTHKLATLPSLHTHTTAKMYGLQLLALAAISSFFGMILSLYSAVSDASSDSQSFYSLSY